MDIYIYERLKVSLPILYNYVKMPETSNVDYYLDTQFLLNNSIN